MNRILVTGVNGFVGHHLVTELIKQSIEVVGIGGPGTSDRNSSQFSSYLQLDLSRPDAAKQIVFDELDGIIHLAGLAAVGPSFDNPMRYITTNIGIEANLIEAALARNASPRFLIISSGNLYAPGAPVPINEASPVLASSPYAVSKIGQEQMAMYYQNRGVECIIARPFNHFGPGQGPGFIVPDLAQQIIEIEKGKASELMVGNLDAKRDYTDVRDIVRAYRLLLEKGKSGETYNVCSGTPRSGHEILEGLLASTEVKPEVKQDPAKMRPSDNPLVYGSHDKLSADTGWQPEIPLETTLSDVIADWRSRS